MMDGLQHHGPMHHTGSVATMRGMVSHASAQPQRSLNASIGCVGVGLHSGRKMSLTLHPAPIGHGVVFRRIDLPGSPEIPARFDHVVDTRLCTTLGLPGREEIRIGTVEHVLAALGGCGIANALIDVDGPEVPILDGSAASFVFLIDCAGIAVQDAPVPLIEVARAIRVQDGAAYAELRPFPFGFDAAVSIAFEAEAIGAQAISLRVTPETFREELAQARTFTMAEEVAQLRNAGLALGGSLENAVVVDGASILNPGGLRMSDEFVRHKLLDVVGDLTLAGGALRARFVSHRTGHALNNKLLHALFSDDANWRPISVESASRNDRRVPVQHQSAGFVSAAA